MQPKQKNLPREAVELTLIKLLRTKNQGEAHKDNQNFIEIANICLFICYTQIPQNNCYRGFIAKGYYIKLIINLIFKKMKKFLIIFCLLVLMALPNLKGQNPFLQGFIDTTTITPSVPEQTTCFSSPPSAFWNNLLNFIPNENSPTYPVHLNIIIIQKTDGSGNYPNDANTFNLFNRVINGETSDIGLNYTWSHLVALQPGNIPPCFNTASGQPIYIPNIKIHFDFSLVFVQNDSYWGSIYPSNQLMNQINNDPSITPGINIYLTVDAYSYNQMVINDIDDPNICTISWANYPNFSNMNAESYVASPNSFTKTTYCVRHSWDKWGVSPEEILRWMVGGSARTFSHELGHSFNLAHECPPHYGLNECIYSIMHQGYQAPGNWLPPTEVGKMVKAIHLTNLKRFINPSVFFPNNPYIVSNYQLWNYNTRVYSDIIVENGGTLEVSCFLQMPQQARIIVKKGGKLIVNGGVITSFGNYLWTGIELQGDPNQMQNDPLYQGYVELKNGATIENAVIGVHCVLNAYIPAKSTVTYYSSGGIVNANGAIFKNNATAINIERYASVYGLSYYVSNINACTFLYTKSIAPQDAAMSGPTYIYLTGVKNVNISANTFIGNTSNAYTLRGIGIDAHDASFNFNDPINPTSVPNVFNDMTYGIRCFNTSPLVKPEICTTTFTNNFHAIYLSGVADAKVMNNTISYKSQNPDTKAYGIYLDNCNNYHVEGNTLSASDVINMPENGIVINNSGIEYNKIYRNSFTKIITPINAQNNNRRVDGMNGLDLLCNNFIGTTTNDIVVTTEVSGYDKGIKQQQGYYDYWIPQNSIPAANLFTYGTIGSPANYVNSSGNLIYYPCYSSNAITYNGSQYNLIPRLGQKPKITLQNTGINWNLTTWENNYCPNQTVSYDGGKSLGSIGSYKEQINVLQPQIDAASAALKQKMDNGNTIALVNRINSCPSTGYGQLYSDLRKYTPYLSEDVLLALIHKQGFQTTLLVNLMLLNTHVAKTPWLMEALQQVQPPLTAAQLQQIQNKENVFSAMEVERLKLAKLVVARDNAYNTVESFYAHDSLPTSNDSLGMMLQRDPRLAAKYQLVYHYFAKDDYTLAEQLLNQIPQMFMLGENAQNEYNKYKQLYELKRSLQSEGKNYNDLNEEQQQILINAINHPSLSLGEMSDLNALRQVNEVVVGKEGKTRGKGITLNYEEPILDPINSKEHNIGVIGSEELLLEGLMDKVLMNENGLTLYPNPASEEVNVLYNVSGDVSNISIEITDITGRNMGNYAVVKNNNSLKINTQSFKKGIYYVILIVDGKRSNVTKLVVL
ncbi:MAG: hypothetical protein AUJ97_00920 [Bacteroidetes bacterium CG2_30_32_10]|nr:MAG: hypothetical protein AUJ97_00920 [Bacteroidetes bacterium CG2_30_32_10]